MKNVQKPFELSEGTLGLLTRAVALGAIFSGKKDPRTWAAVIAFLATVNPNGDNKELETKKKEILKSKKVKSKSQAKALLVKLGFLKEDVDAAALIVDGSADHLSLLCKAHVRIAEAVKKYPAIVAATARKTGASIDEIQRRYDKAGVVATKKFTPETESWWKYKIAVFKQMTYKNPGQNRGGRGTKKLRSYRSE